MNDRPQEARPTRASLFERASPQLRDGFVAGLDQREKNEWDFDFDNAAHAGQPAPETDWRVWLIMAGRGFGKTRAGAEWVRARAESDDRARIALVAASLGEARAVMVEGESGVLACCPPDRRPIYEPSLRRLRWPGGAEATLYSAAEPESLRGPQHSHAAGQAQKEVFVNEAFARIDALLHPVIEGEASEPPLSPEPGECWVVASTASGAWTDREAELASWDGTQWTYCEPQEGMWLFDRSSNGRLVFRDGWQRLARPTGPDGGAVIDSEVRATLAALVDMLATAGLFPPE